MLKAQLAQGSSLNTQRLQSKTSHASYLFLNQSQDLDATLSIAQNAFQILSSVSKQVASQKGFLFGKTTDRTRLDKLQNDALDASIENLLFALAPHLLDNSASKIIEWLVRRYRVQEFNVQALLIVFLPYHETTHFLKLLSILHIPPNSSFSFLRVYQKAISVVHREAIVAEMIANSLFAKFVSGILSKHIASSAEHRVLINFHTATLMRYISAEIPGVVPLAFLLPTLSDPLSQSRSVDIATGSLILLSHLVNKVVLSNQIVSDVLRIIASTKAKVDTLQLLMVMETIFKTQGIDLPEEATTALILRPGSNALIASPKVISVCPRLIEYLIAGLCSMYHEEVALSLLNDLLRSKSLSDQQVFLASKALVQTMCSHPENSRQSLLPLISYLYQLHFEPVRRAIDDVKREDPTVSDAVNDIVSTIAMPEDEMQTDVQSAIVQCSNVDPSLRAQAVRVLLSSAERSDSVIDALRGRLSEVDPVVLQELYADPSIITDMIPVDQLVRDLTAFKEDLSLEALRLHTKFLLSIRAVGALDIEQALFPFLLVAKRGYQSAIVVWKAIQASPPTKSIMFQNTKAYLDKTSLDTMKGDVASMTEFNAAITDIISRNISESDIIQDSVTFLLKQARSTAPSAKITSIVTLCKLFERLDGQNRLFLAQGILKLLSETGMDLLQAALGESADEALDLVNSVTRTVTKSGHTSTALRLQATLLLLLVGIPRPQKIKIDWIRKEGNTSEDKYVQLCRDIYSFLHSSKGSAALSTLALRTFFISLRDEVIWLLASIWIDLGIPFTTRVASLKHTRAFLQANVDESGKMTHDFQTIFPLILSAVSDTQREVRVAATECMYMLANGGIKSRTEPPPIFSADTLPRHISDKLLFLEWADFMKYVQSLVNRSDALVIDPKFAVVLQKELLEVTQEDSSKEAKYKRRALAFILSHARATSSKRLSASLLEATSAIKDVTKLPHVLELLVAISRGKIDDELRGLDREEKQSYLTGLLSAYSGTDPSIECFDQAWDCLLGLIPQAFTKEAVPNTLEALPSTILGILPIVDISRRLQVCSLLATLIAIQQSENPTLRQIISTLLDDNETALSFIESLIADPGNENPSKRARFDSKPEPFLNLIVACESLSSSQQARTPKLMAVLMEALKVVIDARGVSKLDLVNVQQVVMRALENMANNTPPSDDQNIQLRVDILVKLISDGDSPQIIHQALLLIASLAPWSSESILHHILTILLSTGNYVSPRDDLYSARVAQKTIDGIIPLLVQSLQRQFHKKSSLEIAAKPCLNIFVDAVEVIPSHRRQSLFQHLLDAFGVERFTAAFCIFLVERTQLLGSKGSQDGRFEIALGLLKVQSYEQQLSALVDIVEEVLLEVSMIDQDDPTFMASFRDDKSLQNKEPSVFRHIFFVKAALKSVQSTKKRNDEYSQRLLAILVRLLATLDARGNKYDDTEVNLHNEVESSITLCASLVSPSGIVFTCLQLLRTHDTALQAEIYLLLADRLDDMTADARKNISPDVGLTIRVIGEMLVENTNTAVSRSALKAVQAISRSAVTSELAILGEILTTVAKLPAPALSQAKLETLVSLCIALGSRVIPSLSLIVSVSCDHLETNDTQLGAAISILRQLLASLASFWSVENAERLLLCVCRSKHASHEESNSLTAIGKLMAKTLPANTNMEAFVKVRNFFTANPLQKTSNARYMFFYVLRSSIKASNRDVLSASSRPLLTAFLEEWDSQEIDNTTMSTRAFAELTIKLNESSFKPLYRIMFDWAWDVNHNEELRDRRQVAYCHIMSILQNMLKGLMAPYMRPFLDKAVERMNEWASDGFANPVVWQAILELIKQSAEVDDGGLWRDDIFALVTTALVGQISTPPSHNQQSMNTLGGTFSAVAGVVTDINRLKTLNLALLMQTRSTEYKTRLSALHCAEILWSAHGQKMISWKSESLPFLHECAEDANEDVVSAARRLKVVLDRF